MQTLVLAKLVYGPHSQISMRIMSLSFFTRLSKYRLVVINTHLYRAGLKSMQPMQLPWAPRFWGPRAIVFG